MRAIESIPRHVAIVGLRVGSRSKRYNRPRTRARQGLTIEDARSLEARIGIGVALVVEVVVQHLSKHRGRSTCPIGSQSILCIVIHYAEGLSGTPVCLTAHSPPSGR